MRFDSAGKVEQLLWQARLAELPRAENRAILQRLYNGDPPYDEQLAEENNIEINRNSLSGPNQLANGRRQWNNAFLKPGNYFTVGLDSGPSNKRTEYGHIITRNINRLLKRRRPMMEQLRAKGGNSIIYGQGPVIWMDRRSPIPKATSVASILIPSETDISFDNLDWFAAFDELTPAQLYELTHGPKVDPGWNMPMVEKQLRLIGEMTTKQLNATAYQYMPEKIEELYKQDLGFWGSDAVPTIDIWNFYFREKQDGQGWHRRIVLDWGLGNLSSAYDAPMPRDKNSIDGNSTFIYSSGKRKYANSLAEIMQCQFADCSAIFPQKYHSVRSLGWMLWGVCDLENRLYCKFNESVFQQMMWWFRVASDAQLTRLKQASFQHMGVIPNGIEWVKAQDRFSPDKGLLEMAFAKNQQLMAESSSSFTQDFQKGTLGKEMTATETMARVNSVNALVSGMLALAYTYEEYCYREICRRFCIKGNPDADAKKFRLACLKEGVPEDLLDVERWDVTAERVLGAGNKTLEMAQVQFLQGVRPNLTPDAQRRIDHIAIESATDDPALAEELAPVSGMTQISNSTHDAQLATDRLMSGLQYVLPAKAVPEDYVMQWLTDMGKMIETIIAQGGTSTQEEIAGLANMGQHISQLIVQMSSAKEPMEIAKIKQYAALLAKLENEVRALQQRLNEKMKAQATAAQNGNGAGDAALDAQKLQYQAAHDQQKLQSSQQSHAQKLAQQQAAFELKQQNEEREHNADQRRQGANFLLDATQNALTAGQERRQAEQEPALTE